MADVPAVTRRTIAAPTPLRSLTVSTSRNGHALKSDQRL
jgi:hypothetical protein